MTEPHKVHRYAQVDRPYESVRRVLHKLLVAGDAAPVSVHSICDQHHVAGLPDLTRATLGVKDPTPYESNRLTSAEIYASALSPSATHIEIEAHCVDGSHGRVDATARDLAETHVHTLLESVIEHIRREIDRPVEPPADAS